MRKTKIVVIHEEGRDKGKRFVIREMAALYAEKWATRALLALAKSGVDIGEAREGGGMAAIAAQSLQALGTISFADAEPLLDELLACVQIMPDPSNPEMVRPLVLHSPNGDGDDIEEIGTFLKLRMEALTLHVGFFGQGAPLTGTSSQEKASAPPDLRKPRMSRVRSPRR